MERGETTVNRMTVAFPLQLENHPKVLRFKEGVRRSFPFPVMAFCFLSYVQAILQHGRMLDTKRKRHNVRAKEIGIETTEKHQNP